MPLGRKRRQLRLAGNIHAAGSRMLDITARLFVSVGGQSLGSGSAAIPSFSSGSDPFGNKKVDDIVGHNQLTNMSDPVQEKPLFGLCDWVSSRETNRVLTGDTWALGGTAYSGLKSGSTPYNNGISGLRAAQSSSVGAGSGSIHNALVWIQGETDELQQASGSQYVDYLKQLQSDWEGDFQAIATSSAAVPLVYYQCMNHTAFNPFKEYPEVAQAQYQAHLSQSNLVLAGAFYHVPQNTSSVGHLNNSGSRLMGEYIGKVVQRVIISGSTWIPLRPSNVAANGSALIVDIEGGDGSSISIDTSSVSYRSFNGFRVLDSSATGPQITYVTQSGNRQVTIGLTSTAHANTQLVYGLYGAAGSVLGPAGSAYAPGGNIRDNDPTTAYANPTHQLPNWLVGFRRNMDSFIAGSEPIGTFSAPTQSQSTAVGKSLHCGRLPASAGTPGTTAMVWSLWFRKTSGNGPTASETLMGANVTGHRWTDIGGLDGSGNLIWYIPTTNVSTAQKVQTTGKPCATSATWYHVCGFFYGAGVLDADKAYMAINGTANVLGITGTLPSAMTPNNSSSFEIGSNQNGNAFTGVINNVSLWINPSILPAAFPALAVELYNAGVPGDLNLASLGQPSHWWTLNGTMIDSGSVLPHNHAAPLGSGSFSTIVQP